MHVVLACVVLSIAALGIGSASAAVQCSITPNNTVACTDDGKPIELNGTGTALTKGQRIELRAELKETRQELRDLRQDLREIQRCLQHPCRCELATSP